MDLFFFLIDDRTLTGLLLTKEIKILKKVRKVVRASNWEGIQTSDNESMKWKY